MKELKIKIGGLWSCITAIVIAAMLCGTAVFISVQSSQTQKDIAEIQAQANKEAAGKIGTGTCLSGDGKNRLTCENL